MRAFRKRLQRLGKCHILMTHEKTKYVAPGPASKGEPRGSVLRLGPKITDRIGHTVMSVGQLKILQEVITLTVFVPFSIFYLKEDLKWDYLWAGLCILGAVFFVFREKLTGA